MTYFPRGNREGPNGLPPACYNPDHADPAEQWVTPEQLTVAAIVIATAVGIYQAGRKKIWVWGYQLEDERAEKELWRGLYFRVAGLTEDLIAKEEPAGDHPPTMPAPGRRARRPAVTPRARHAG